MFNDSVFATVFTLLKSVHHGGAFYNSFKLNNIIIFSDYDIEGFFDVEPVGTSTQKVENMEKEDGKVDKPTSGSGTVRMTGQASSPTHSFITNTNNWHFTYLGSLPNICKI